MGKDREMCRCADVQMGGFNQHLNMGLVVMVVVVVIVVAIELVIVGRAVGARRTVHCMARIIFLLLRHLTK